MEPERSLEDTEMLSNRHRGSDSDSAEGRKEELLLQRMKHAVSHRKTVWRTQLAQDVCRAGPGTRAAGVA